MPFAADFRAAAVVLDDEAATTDGLPATLAGAVGPDVLIGGALTADTNALVDTTGLDCTTDAETLRDLAVECRRRAEVCDDAAAALEAWGTAMWRHENAMSTWRADYRNWERDGQAFDHPGTAPSAPTRPTPPFDWVEI